MAALGESAGRRAAQFVGRAAAGGARQDLRQDLRISGLPRTATHDDVWRLLRRLNIAGANRVYLHYNRFKPTGVAFVSLANLQASQPAQEALRLSHMSTFPLAVRAHSIEAPGRTRGVEGREEAMRRGIVTGTGADAGIAERGTAVVLSGCPGRWYHTHVRVSLCEGFELRDAGEATIVAVVPPSGKAPAVTSRWLVRMASESEAHRFARKVHRTIVTSNNKEYLIHADVVY
ncbi:hypothetical protein EXIGLDRAFT_783333 [Exidia glandulosa HHB12029]|uniref:RRM domain-containing protein n=1 Tax=Exidia glandulosa HHB12029 TaxID=1314781 RepID=A0A166N4B3_EXIGL|nr:hypothetical protein EXIGLDRAFT_783333 [Exidia glandulosa HHB12029]